MSVKWGNTSEVHTEGIKVLIYGGSGAGKTRAIATAPAPFIVSCEKGLLSLRGFAIPYAHVQNLSELREVYEYLSRSADARRFATVALDSVTDFAEMALAAELLAQKDPRKGYLEMQRQMNDVVRLFRELPGRNVVMTAKQTSLQDEMSGTFRVMPAMPGRTATENLPHYFDEVWRAHTMRTPTQENPQAVTHLLQCKDDGTNLAKDRSDILAPLEWPDLASIFARMAQINSAA